MKTQIMASAIMALALVSSAFAQDNSTPAHKHKHHLKQVIQACATANHIALPAKGSGEKLSSADRQTIHACVQEFREDFKTCIQKAGISKPQPGEKPSDAEIAAFKQCRTEAVSEISGQ